MRRFFRKDIPGGTASSKTSDNVDGKNLGSVPVEIKGLQCELKVAIDKDVAGVGAECLPVLHEDLTSLVLGCLSCWACHFCGDGVAGVGM